MSPLASVSVTSSERHVDWGRAASIVGSAPVAPTWAHCATESIAQQGPRMVNGLIAEPLISSAIDANVRSRADLTPSPEGAGPPTWAR